MEIFMASAASILFLGLLFWVYKDAVKNGKNGFLWLFILAFLNIPGLLIYLALREKLTGP